jgi:hypothetical protein
MQSTQESRQIAEILDLLCTEPARHRNSKSQLPRFFKIFLIVLIASAVGSVVVVAVAKFGWMPRAEAIGWSYGLLGFSELSALMMSLSIAWSFPREMNQSLARVRSSTLQIDHLLISRLRSFPSQDLEYLSERLQLEAEQLRSRVGLAVGALDKVGIIPLLAGSAYTLWKFHLEANFRHIYINIGLAFLTSFYGMGLWLFPKSYRADQHAQLLKSAASANNRSPENDAESLTHRSRSPDQDC